MFCVSLDFDTYIQSTNFEVEQILHTAYQWPGLQLAHYRVKKSDFNVAFQSSIFSKSSPDSVQLLDDRSHHIWAEFPSY